MRIGVFGGEFDPPHVGHLVIAQEARYRLELDRLLVGLSDGEGGFTGIGYLEPVSGNGGLRLISPVAEPPKALRLGSVRLEESFRAKRVDLRNLFGTE